MLGWQDDRLLKDVLPAKDAAKIKKAFGYTTCGQLLSHYPRDYIRHNKEVGLGGANEGDYVTVTGQVLRLQQRNTGKAFLLTLSMDNGITATFFNAHYLTRVLRQGMRLMLSGKLKFFRGQPQLQHPDFVIIDAAWAERCALRRRRFSKWPQAQGHGLSAQPLAVWPTRAAARAGVDPCVSGQR